jgi:dihydrofolate reductase
MRKLAILTFQTLDGVMQFKEQDGALLQVHGSWRLIQTLLAHNLIDEFRLWTFPVIAGSGKRLFAEGAVPADLTLIKSGACPTGATMGIYRHA